MPAQFLLATPDWTLYHLSPDSWPLVYILPCNQNVWVPCSGIEIAAFPKDSKIIACQADGELYLTHVKEEHAWTTLRPAIKCDKIPKAEIDAILLAVEQGPSDVATNPELQYPTPPNSISEQAEVVPDLVIIKQKEYTEGNKIKTPFTPVPFHVRMAQAERGEVDDPEGIAFDKGAFRELPKRKYTMHVIIDNTEYEFKSNQHYRQRRGKCLTRAALAKDIAGDIKEALGPTQTLHLPGNISVPFNELILVDVEGPVASSRRWDITRPLPVLPFSQYCTTTSTIFSVHSSGSWRPKFPHVRANVIVLSQGCDGMDGRSHAGPLTASRVFET